MSNSREPNRKSPQGIAFGEQMARLCDQECTKLIVAKEWQEDERCVSCAFRAGTVPNGCLQTQADIMKAVLEHEPFFCHMAPTVCAGWFASVQATKNLPKITCPWKFSPDE